MHLNLNTFFSRHNYPYTLQMHPVHSFTLIRLNLRIGNVQISKWFHMQTNDRSLWFYHEQQGQLGDIHLARYLLKRGSGEACARTNKVQHGSGSRPLAWRVFRLIFIRWLWSSLKHSPPGAVRPDSPLVFGALFQSYLNERRVTLHTSKVITSVSYDPKLASGQVNDL